MNESEIEIPRACGSLLLTYPRSWRRQHGEVVLGTLLAVHAEEGRMRPTLGDRARFAADGIRVRVGARFAPRPVRRFADLSTVPRVHAFDQGNGLAAGERELDAREQTRANGEAARNSDIDRINALAYCGLADLR